MLICKEDAADSFNNRSWGMTMKFQENNLTGITLPLSNQVLLRDDDDDDVTLQTNLHVPGL